MSKDIVYKSINYNLSSVAGHTLSSDDEIRSSGSITWTEAKCLDLPVEYASDSGSVRVFGEFSEAASQFNHTYQFLDMSQSDAMKHLNDLMTKKSEDIRARNTAQIKVVVAKPSSAPGTHRHYAELYLSDLFLAFNLASPGCFNLCTKFHLEGVTDSELTLKRNSGFFQRAYALSIDESWNCITTIPLPRVIRWLSEIRGHTTQTATSRAEKALFALLHFSSNSDLSPSALIWLTHALEALYETPSETVAKTLINRIFAFLSLPDSSRKRKQFRDLYELRSAFVHGRLPIIHPEQNDILDEEIIKHNEAYISSLELGMLLVVATIQKLILNNWKEMQFTETVDGVVL